MLRAEPVPRPAGLPRGPAGTSGTLHPGSSPPLVSMRLPCVSQSDGTWRRRRRGEEKIKFGATFSPDLLILHPVFPCTSLLIGLSSPDSSLPD